MQDECVEREYGESMTSDHTHLEVNKRESSGIDLRWHFGLNGRSIVRCLRQQLASQPTPWMRQATGNHKARVKNLTYNVDDHILTVKDHKMGDNDQYLTTLRPFSQIIQQMQNLWFQNVDAGWSDYECDSCWVSGPGHAGSSRMFTTCTRSTLTKEDGTVIQTNQCVRCFGLDRPCSGNSRHLIPVAMSKASNHTEEKQQKWQKSSAEVSMLGEIPEHNDVASDDSDDGQ